jgi:hypothetical protein
MGTPARKELHPVAAPGEAAEPRRRPAVPRRYKVVVIPTEYEAEALEAVLDWLAARGRGR